MQASYCLGDFIAQDHIAGIGPKHQSHFQEITITATR